MQLQPSINSDIDVILGRFVGLIPDKTGVQTLAAMLQSQKMTSFKRCLAVFDPKVDDLTTVYKDQGIRARVSSSGD